MQVQDGVVVTLAFTARDADGTVIEHHDEPTSYLQGHDNFIPGLEASVAGLSAGESFEVTLDDAYGPAHAGEPMPVPRKELPKHWRLVPGFEFEAPGSQGQRAKLYVHRVKGSRVYVSPAHPRAGRSVHFKGVIVHVRGSTLEERNHGHAHGPGGHNH